MNTDKIYAEAVANEYAVKDESKVIALKKLDAKAKRPASVFAYTLGIASTLLLGVGMCLSMVFDKLVLGIVVGIIGIVALLMLIPLTKGLK